MNKKTLLFGIALSVIPAMVLGKQLKGDSFSIGNTKDSGIALVNGVTEDGTGRLDWGSNPKAGIQGSFSAGIWKPQADLGILGPHPYLGFQLGARTPTVTVSLTGTGRILNSSNKYQVYHDDSLYTGDWHWGYGMAFEMGYIFSFGARHTLDLTGAAGFDGILLEAYERNEESNRNGYITRMLSSFTFQLGCSYKLWTTKRNYIGLEAKYNFLFYSNKWGSDFGGNAFSIGIVTGGVLSRGRMPVREHR